MDFGIMFFDGNGGAGAADRYDLFLRASQFADSRGFCCVWTPERHFHPFGGLFPNPAITSAAIAALTNRLQIRAGSLISPLHNTIRVAEEWAMLDNLSQGRIGISFGSGWNANDFVLFPERYADRRRVMYQQIEEIRDLWRGGQVVGHNGAGKEIGVNIFPTPIQPDLPVWVTSSAHLETFIEAGAIGANILTHLINQNIAELAEKISQYRLSRAVHNLPSGQGKVSLMLHTFIGEDAAQVRRRTYGPFREYLRSAISLEMQAAKAGGVISGSYKMSSEPVRAELLEQLLDEAFEKYFVNASLMGTVEHCQQLVEQLEEIEVNEIACLIDFIDDKEAVMESLEFLDLLRERCAGSNRNCVPAAEA